MIGLEFIVTTFKYSFSSVARELDINPTSVHDWIKDWIKGKRKIPQARLKQLSEIFNLPTEYFNKELTEVEKAFVELTYIQEISNEIFNKEIKTAKEKYDKALLTEKIWNMINNKLEGYLYLGDMMISIKEVQ